MSDEEVIYLYRILLGRLPEGDDTVNAFKAYYPSLEAGRVAIIATEEFRRMYAKLASSGTGDAGEISAALAKYADMTGAPVLAGLPDLACLRMMLERLSSVNGKTVRLCIGEESFAATHSLPGADCTVWIGNPGSPNGLTGSIPETVGPQGFKVGGDLRTLDLLCRTLEIMFTEVIWLGSPDVPHVGLIPGMLADNGTLIFGRDVDDAHKGWIAGCGFERLIGKDFAAFRRNSVHMPLLWEYVGGNRAKLAKTAAARRASVPKLAIASIVRNEERSIGAMIDSCLPVASFFAILDTGSTDNTIRIAEAALQAGGVPFHIAKAQFAGFDTARNTAADLVPPEFEWTLMLDADEELDPSEFGVLQDLLTSQDVKVYALPRYNYWDSARVREPEIYPDRQRRLFRNTPDRPRFVGAVHETIHTEHGLADAPLNAQLIGGSSGGPHIHHFVRAIRTAAEEQAKQLHYRQIAGQVANPSAS